MSKKKIHQEFLDEIYSLVGNEYSILGYYKGNNIKILIRHNLCGHEYEVVPYGFLNGRRCPICRSLKKTPEKYKQEFFKATNDKFELISSYVNARTKVKIKHLECGTIFETEPNRFIKKVFCPTCSIYNRTYNRKKRMEDVIEEIKDIRNGEYRIIRGSYNGKNSNLEFMHLKCGTKFSAIWHDFKNSKSGCPKCGYEKLKQINLKSKEDFEKDFKKRADDEFELLSDYVKSNVNIKIRHNKCGYEWKCTPNNFLRGSGCPKCNESKGERKISLFLDRYNILYIKEHKFEGCKNTRSLPFDFFLPKQKICIEYDRKFHYKELELGNDLQKQLINDNIKTEYCKKNKIKLIRIPYWEFDNIENILSSSIKIKKTIPSEASSETTRTCND